MERNIINAYLKQFRKVVYENKVELYFNQQNQVLGIKTNFTTVIAVENDCVEKDIMLVSYLFNGQTATVEIPSRKTFVIPDKKDVILFKDAEEIDEIMLSAFPNIYEIVCYGPLEDEMFKGAKMSRCRLNVLIANASLQYYETTFIAGDNIAGVPILVGDNAYYDGNVEKGYVFTTLGKFFDGVVLLDLKKE